VLILKNSNQIHWADLPFIEAPAQAKRSLERNILGRVGSEFIDNQGGFCLKKGPNKYSLIESQLENGQAFIINRCTIFPSLAPVTVDKNNKIDWSFKVPANDILRNVMESIIHRIELPGNYVYEDVDNKTQTQVSKQPDKKVEEKHQLKIQYELVAGANNPTKYEIKLCVMKESTQQISMRQALDVMNAGTSKVFKLEQGEKFKVYPMREHMADVRQDLSQNKNFQQSESNERIKSLIIETSEPIAGGVTLHTVTIKIPPILRMGCFFDGTGNDESDPVKYSNVQKLSISYGDALKKLPDSYHLEYVRGVGSDGDGPIDRLMGSAAGIGAIERVAGMLHELEKACDRYLYTYKHYPETIHLDVFGFSRGATTTRHFMNVLKQGFYGFNDKKLQTYITPQNIMFSFVGLFDSVGSYGIAGDNEDYGYNFHVKPQWLTEKAKVIHLIALNEYRENFDLQTIFQDQNKKYPEDRIKGKVHELGLIGAHSDVGGSYAPNEQGVINDGKNPSQLSLMALEKMYEFAKTCDVPLASLNMLSRESGLVDNYQVLTDAFQDKALRKLWAQWVEYKKYQQILKAKLKNVQKLAPRSKKEAVKTVNKKLSASTLQIEKLKGQLEVKLGVSGFEHFQMAYEHLEKYYIHESHGPFNDGIFMGAEQSTDQLNVQHLTRTVFFKPAVDFEQVNKDLDRISYRRGMPIKVDIDEFDFVMAKPFQ
jgi:hypothetical protein